MNKYAFAVQCEKVIIMNGKMCLQQPLCFHSQNFVRQFLDILREDLVIQNGRCSGSNKCTVVTFVDCVFPHVD